ncbi:MAG: TIM barrel protein [Pseudomonadota bacterium]
MAVVFSANLGFLWKDRPFLERIAAARSADFTMVEFHDDAQDHSVEDLKAALGGLPIAGLNVRHRDSNGLAALPGREEDAARDIAEAAERAKALGASAVHVMSGRTGDAGGAQRLTARLKDASAAHPDLTFLIEPICPQAVPGYFLTTVEQGADIIAAVAAPNVKIMFDCFHVQRAGGDILARYQTHKELVGHIQIAGGHSRAEPDRGEINYPWLIPALQDAGYGGAFGAEYTPTTTVEAGLSWRDAFVAT